MIPIRIELENFRSFAGPTEIPLDFAPLFCIVGPNGAGKSSIVEAMLWALFGASREGKSRTDAPLRTNAPYVRVSFDFVMGGRTYRVLRRAGKGGHKIALLKYEPQMDSFVPAVGTNKISDNQRAITDLLGANYEGLSLAMVFMQNRASLFSTMTPAERHKVLVNFLGIQKYAVLYDKVHTARRDVAGAIRIREEDLLALGEQLAGMTDPRPQLEEVVSQINSLRKDIEDLRRKLKEYQGRRASLEAMSARKSALEKDLAEKKSRAGEIREEIGKLEGEIEALEAVIARRDQILRDYAEFEKLQKERRRLTRLGQEYAHLVREISALKEQISAAEKTHQERIGKLSGEMEHIRAEIASLEKKLSRRQEVRAKIEELEVQRRALDEMTRRKNEHEQIDAQITQLRREIAIEEQHIRERIEYFRGERNRIAKKTGEREKVAAQLEQVRGELADAERLAAQREEILAQISAVEAEIGKLQQKREGISAQIAEKRKQKEFVQSGERSRCPMCGSELTGEHREKLLRKLGDEIAELAQSGAEIDEQIKSLRRQCAQLAETTRGLPTRDDVEKIRRRAQELETALALIDKDLAQIGKIDREIKELEESLATRGFAAPFEAKISRLAERQREIGYEPEALEALKKMVESLAKFEREWAVLEENRRRLERLKNTLIQYEAEYEKLKSQPVAQKLREQLAELEKKLSALDYNPQRIKEVESRLERFADAQRRKIELENALARHPQLRERRESLRHALEKIEAEIPTIEEKIAQIAGELAHLPEIEAHIAEIEEKIARSESRLAELGDQKAELTAALRRYEDIVSRRKEIESQLTRHRRRERLLAITEGILSREGIQDWLMRGYLEQIETYANDTLSLLSDGALSVRLVPESGEKLEVNISDPLGERSYESYSGGEEFRIDFSLRLAMSRVLAERSGFPLQTLIIDEGFGSQDEEGIGKLTDILYQVQDWFERIIVISHLPVIKESFPARLEVFRDSGGNSQVRVVA